MTKDSVEIYEKYVRLLNEARMPKGTPRPDVILSKQHIQKTTPSVGADAPDAQGATIGRNTALTLGQSDKIRDKNFEEYKNQDIEEGLYLDLTGEGSEVSSKSQKLLMNLTKQKKDNKYFSNIINGNLSIPYWIVPDCIQYFISEAKSEKNTNMKQAYIDAIVFMYEAMTDEITYKSIYRNSKPVLRFKQEGGRRELEELKDTYEEFLPKIEKRIRALKSNPPIGLLLNHFLFHNHTKPRQQVKFGSNIFEDVSFVHAKGSGEHTIFGQGENEPRHPFSGTDPTYGVSSAENITEPELRKIHIQDREQAISTPSPAISLGAPKAKRVRKKPIGESVFIKDIPF